MKKINTGSFIILLAAMLSCGPGAEERMKIKQQQDSIVLADSIARQDSIIRSKSDISRMKIMGNVKSITELTYNAIRKGNEIAKGKLQYKDVTLFNQYGYMTETSSFEGNGNLRNRNVCTYDEKFRKTEESFYNTEGLWEKTLSEYDSTGTLKGLTIKKRDGSVDEKRTAHYDAKGNLTETRVYLANGELYGKFLFKYDENGRMIDQGQYYPDGSMVGKTREKFSYDTVRNLTEVKYYNSDGSMDGYYRYQYNEHDDLTEQSGFTSYGHRYCHEVYKYEYDPSLKSWVREIRITHDEPNTVTERVFEYY